MKITSTKKLSIIIFALVCAVAAGLGVLFTKNTQAAGYAEEAQPIAETLVAEADLTGESGEEAEYDERYDEGVLYAIAEQTGIAYQDVLFYV